MNPAEPRPCHRTEAHPRHSWVLARNLYRCPGVTTKPRPKGCKLDTDGDGNCHEHCARTGFPDGCPPIAGFYGEDLKLIEVVYDLPFTVPEGTRYTLFVVPEYHPQVLVTEPGQTWGKLDCAPWLKRSLNE